MIAMELPPSAGLTRRSRRSARSIQSSFPINRPDPHREAPRSGSTLEGEARSIATVTVAVGSLAQNSPRPYPRRTRAEMYARRDERSPARGYLPCNWNCSPRVEASSVAGGCSNDRAITQA